MERGAGGALPAGAGIGAVQRTMDDRLIFGDDRDRLLAQRDAIVGWLDVERGLALKDPDARPQSTFAPLIYLGHRLTRDDIRLGKKALDRLPAHLRRAAEDPERARQVTASFAATFVFGRGLGGDDAAGGAPK